MSESKDVNNTDKASSSVAKPDSRSESDSANTDRPINAQANVASDKATTRQGGGKGLAFVALLFSLLAVAAVAATWYQNQVQKVAADSALAVDVANIGGNVSRLGDAIVRLQAQQDGTVSKAELSSEILRANVQLEARLSELATQQESIASAIEALNQEFGKSGADYLLDEVSHLLKLANTNAVFNGDADAAIGALQLADIQLKELASPKYSAVRVSINREIALLKAVPRVDTENISARLGVLSDSIVSLSLANEPPTLGAVKLVEQQQTEQVTWRTELRKIWRDMVNSVQVQRVDQPPKPLLAPQQRYFLNQNLQLSLSKAELALLQGRPKIYRDSLTEASDWLIEYFDMKDPDVQNTLSEIAALSELPVLVEVPSVAKSYDLLQSIKGGQ